jgi:hypothetical protein
MPMTALLDLSPTGAKAKSGNLTHSSQSTATSITSFSTNSIKDIFQNNSVLLATLQEPKIALVQLVPEFVAPPKLSSRLSRRP